MARVNGRNRSWQRTSRHIIIISVIFEAVAVGFAIMTTRSMDMNWKMRAIRLFFFVYYSSLSIGIITMVGVTLLMRFSLLLLLLAGLSLSLLWPSFDAGGQSIEPSYTASFNL
ncbi:hypothetical protein HN51_022428 [Arachis hypogaea]|nr:uncharacterized protein DS421_2g49900 [Arachis hypogaea]